MTPPFIVGITGASGVVYGVRLLEVLLEMERPVALVVSESGRLVIREEMGLAHGSLTRKEDWAELLRQRGQWGQSPSGTDPLQLSSLEVYSPRDFSAPIASGSYPTGGMVVIPCSMGTLGAIANGISQHLIHRAADCTIKEGRKLVLVPRETPLSAIHLENMLKLSRLGVGIVPAMPGFYSGAATVEEMIDFVVGKALDAFGISHSLYPRWTGLQSR